ncbi:MAG: Crp/Fnr family transcriptional regulator [Microscillaceae bacterium]|nr:Crp/Fnr family transcriptional regulator [Microscillaceae bacterium]MDW8460325.1 Crp/Fnr family transcriptional regulator [Cytophagales bacterium]
MLQKLVPDIVNYAVELSIPPNTYIFEAGEEKKGIFYIRRGGVAIFHKNKYQKEILTHFVGKGYTIGINCIEAPTHTNSAKTIAPTTVLSISTQTVEHLMAVNIQFRFFILQEACKQIQQLELKFMQNQFQKKSEMLEILFKDLCHLLDEETLQSPISLPISEICDKLEIPIQLFQKFLKELVLKDCIEQRGEMIVFKKTHFFSAQKHTHEI